MRKNEVVIGGSYLAKVSGSVVPVQITGQSRFGGWEALNAKTGKTVRIKSAQRLRRPADAKTKAAVASDNILLQVEPGQFADALNKATAEQLADALKLECWSAKQRNRIEIALKVRSEPAKAPADDVARTVAAVEAGNLAKGVTVPMPAGRRAAQGRDGAAPGASGAGKPTRDARPAAERPTGQLSGLDAAAKVLAEAGQPMNARQIVAAMAAKGYWSSTARTPHATIYAAMLMEIVRKGDASRFRKAGRGLFAVTAVGKKAE